MELDQELLRELHRIHCQKEDLADRIERGPRQLVASENHLKQANSQLDAAKETQKNSRKLADEKQLLMGEREAKIDKVQANLNASETNKEFQALKDRIAAEKTANEVLADEIFELLERIDTEAETIKTCQAAVEKATKANQEISGKVAEEKVSLESELNRVENLLAEAEKRIPDGFKDDYLRLTKGKGSEAMAQVDDECCGSCYQTLKVQVFSNLYMNKPVFCGACGSVLYLLENHKVPK